MSIGFVVGFSIFLQFCAVLLSLRLMTSPKNRIAALLIMGSCSLSARGRIITTSDTLRLALGRQEASPLSPLAPGVFVAVGTHLEVARDRRGAITARDLSGGRP